MAPRLVQLARLLGLLVLLSPLLTTAQDNSIPPIITAIWGCPLSPDNVTIQCEQPRPGQLVLLTIAGYNFGNIRTVLVNVSGGTWYTQTTNACNDGRSCVQANLPSWPQYGPAGELGGVLPVNVVQVNSGSAAVSNTFYGLRMLPTPPLVLSTISGCSGSGQTTDDCVLSGVGNSTLTMTGSGFRLLRQPLAVVMPAYGLSWLLYDVPSSTSVTFPLSLTLSALSRIVDSAPPAAGIAVCLQLDALAMSNCLTISVRSNASSPLPPPASPFSTSAAITVTAVSGCPVSTATTTSQCRLPASLTIRGSGFNVNASVVLIGGTQCTGTVLDAETLTCVFPNVAIPAPVDMWLPAVVWDVAAMQQSAPFLGMSYTAPPRILVSSISGCAGDSSPPSLATSGCDPINGTLTVVGSGFVTNDQPWYSRLGYVGSSSSALFLDLAPYIVDAQTVVLPMSALIPDYLSSTLVLNATFVLCLTHYEVYGEQPKIGSACPVFSMTVPVPVVTSVSGCNASAPAGGLAVVGCLGGGSTVVVTGSNLGYPITATLAGQRCSVAGFLTRSVSIALPLLVGLQAFVPYDLVLSNPLYNVTLPGAITFAPSPVLGSITSQFCVPDPSVASPTALLCPVGAVLTLVGSYFSPAENITVLLTPTASRNSPSQPCPNVTFDSSNVLTCVLPQPAFELSVGYSLVWQVVVQETGAEGAFVSNALLAQLYYNATTEPHIDSVTGCLGSDAVTRGVVGCSPGNVVTLHGSNFVNSSGTEVRLWMYGAVFVCQKPTVLSATQLQCVLPFVLESTADDLLPVTIVNMAGRRSNWLAAINYQATVANPTQAQVGAADDSADRTRFTIALGVLLPLLLLSLALNAALLYARRERKLTAGRTGGWETQRDAGDDTQMAHWAGAKRAGG